MHSILEFQWTTRTAPSILETPDLQVEVVISMRSSRLAMAHVRVVGPRVYACAIATADAAPSASAAAAAAVCS